MFPDEYVMCPNCGNMMPSSNSPFGNSNDASYTPFAQPDNSYQPYGAPESAYPEADSSAETPFQPFGAGDGSYQPGGVPDGIYIPQMNTDNGGSSKKGKKNKKSGKNKESKKPDTPEGNKKKKKIIALGTGAVALACVIALVVTSIIGHYSSSPLMVEPTSGSSTDNRADIKDDITVVDDSKLEKGITELSYDADAEQYTLTYKELPDKFKNLQEDDLFIVPSDPDAKNYSFQTGFSGRVISVSNSSIVFTIPEFRELFDYFKVSDDSVSASNVSFTPADGVEIDSIIPNAPLTASVGGVSSHTAETKIGSYTFDAEYKKPDKESQLDGYNILARKVSLKIEKDLKKDGDSSTSTTGSSKNTSTTKKDDGKEKSLSGKITLDYPAVKFNYEYDGAANNIKNYDVGFITEQSFSITLKGSTEVNPLPTANLDVGKYGIIDLADTSDLEPGKVVLGSLFLGLQVPVSYNAKNMTPNIGIGVVFQICLTATGKIEAEWTTTESGFFKAEADSDGNVSCELKNDEYPNPVLGETGDANTNYDGFSVETNIKGSFDAKFAFGVDVGFSILGTIPIKIANDIIGTEAAAEGEVGAQAKITINGIKDFSADCLQILGFWQIKSESVLRINVGGKFKIKKVELELMELGYQKTMWNNVWYQFPETKEFTIDECDFGGVKLGESYTDEEIDNAFYDKLNQVGKSSLSGKSKDKLIQATVDALINKFNYDVQDIMDFLPISGKYDLTCYSEGAIYFLDNGCVKAEMITGDDVYNSSSISHASSETKVRTTYSEPKQKESVEISFGELGALLMKELGLEKFLQLDGTEITYYHYESENDEANMDIFFDGDGDIIFIIAYL